MWFSNSFLIFHFEGLENQLSKHASDGGPPFPGPPLRRTAPSLDRPPLDHPKFRSVPLFRPDFFFHHSGGLLVKLWNCGLGSRPCSPPKVCVWAPWSHFVTHVFFLKKKKITRNLEAVGTKKIGLRATQERRRRRKIKKNQGK